MGAKCIKPAWEEYKVVKKEREYHGCGEEYKVVKKEREYHGCGEEYNVEKGNGETIASTL